jgi:molybdopterin-guanine dinucleotide biosynthesis protein A
MKGNISKFVTGAVLAGGKSRRFGKNKALEVFLGKRLIDHSVETISRFCTPVFIVAGDLKPFANVRATLVRDIIPGGGPLVGIYTALLFSPHDWIFVKGVDMPFTVPDLLRLMLEQKKYRYDIIVPRLNGH